MNFLTTKLFITLSIGFLFISCDTSNEKNTPSIANNSTHLKKESKSDYAAVPSSKLLKQIQAHYELEQFGLAKDKLIFLQKTYPDSLDGIDIHDVQAKIDQKLAETQKRIQEKNRLAQNERLSNSLDKMRYEQVNGTTIYYDVNSPKFSTKECFYAYIILEKGKPKLFFRIRYIANEFLDIQDYMINVDKLDYIFNGNVEKSQLKGKKKYTVELFDKELVSNEAMAKIAAIATGKEVVAVYVGSNTYAKREISTAQKTSIQNVLDAYAYLKEIHKFKR